jgi:hypothetical protein
VGDRKHTRVDQRILHLDVAAAALKLVSQRQLPDRAVQQMRGMHWARAEVCMPPCAVTTVCHPVKGFDN